MPKRICKFLFEISTMSNVRRYTVHPAEAWNRLTKERSHKVFFLKNGKYENKERDN